MKNLRAMLAAWKEVYRPTGSIVEHSDVDHGFRRFARHGRQQFDCAVDLIDQSRSIRAPENKHVSRVAWDCRDRKSTRLNSSHGYISYAVFCLKKKKKRTIRKDQ